MNANDHALRESMSIFVTFALSSVSAFLTALILLAIAS